MGEAFYRSEPVVRAVMNRCDRQFREEYGVSLLEVTFGRSNGDGDMSDPALAQPAIYALECALTALWRSVGVSPSLLLGNDIGEVAAAQAAGMVSLEDGLRLAAGLNGHDSVIPAINTSPPSAELISSLTGQSIEPSELASQEHWRRLIRDGAKSGNGRNGLNGLEVDLAVELGTLDTPGSLVKDTWPTGRVDASGPAVLGALVQQTPGDENGGNEEFVKSIAKAYEGGLGIHFAGLFAGEQRRRISVPGYPFQSRRFWVQSRSGSG